MTNERAIELFNLAVKLVFTEEDENVRELDAEDGKPTYLLCDEIWDILDESGHGTPIIIHHYETASEVLIYDRYASQDDNIKFMGHIFEALEDGLLVTVNGTNIFDLY